MFHVPLGRAHQGHGTPAYRCVLAVCLPPADKLMRQTGNTQIQACTNLDLDTQISGIGKRGSNFMLPIPEEGNLAEKSYDRK